MEDDNKGLNAAELENVSGGKVIEGKDGKFYVVPEETPSFEKKEQAEKVDDLHKKIESLKQKRPNIYIGDPPYVPPIRPGNPGMFWAQKPGKELPAKNDSPLAPTNDLPNAPKND